MGLAMRATLITLAWALLWFGRMVCAAEPAVKFEFPEPKSPQLKREWKKEMENRAEDQNAAEFFDKLFLWPRPLVISIEECNAKKTFYSSKGSKITMCYETLLDLREQARKRFPKPTERAFAERMEEVALFLLLHELGHAVIDMFAVKFSGREEDVADQIATKILLAFADPELKVSAVAWYFEQGENPIVEDALADAHSLDRQRLYNVLCWAYGSNTEKYAQLAEDIPELQARSSGCKHEYKKLAEWFAETLKPYLGALGTALLLDTSASEPRSAPNIKRQPEASVDGNRFEVAQGGSYAHPRYPGYVLSLNGSRVSILLPPGAQGVAWDMRQLPESEWAPLTEPNGRAVPVQLMRNGNRLFARWVQ